MPLPAKSIFLRKMPTAVNPLDARFSSVRVIQAVSVEEYKELTVMLALLLPPPPCTPSTLPSLSPERQSSGSRRDSGSCLPQDEAIRQVARRLLSEEAVVCAVSMYRVCMDCAIVSATPRALRAW